jgi:hypothetical protein
MTVSLTGVHFVDVYAVDVSLSQTSLLGIYPTGLHPVGCASHGRAYRCWCTVTRTSNLEKEGR